MLAALPWKFCPGSCPRNPVMEVSFCLSRSGCLFLVVMTCLAFSSCQILSGQFRPVLPVLFCLSCPPVLPACPVRLARFVCPVQPLLFCLSCSCMSGPGFHVLAVLSWQSCSACPVLAVLFWLSCSACPVLAVLFWLSVLAVLFCLSCSACPVLPVLFFLSRACSWVPPVLFWLSCPGCPVLVRYRDTSTKSRAQKPRSANERARKIGVCSILLRSKYL